MGQGICTGKSPCVTAVGVVELDLKADLLDQEPDVAAACVLSHTIAWGISHKGDSSSGSPDLQGPGEKRSAKRHGPAIAEPRRAADARGCTLRPVWQRLDGNVHWGEIGVLSGAAGNEGYV